ncbi:hypothetical protein ABZ319_01640 [Nocardia sp. NPDC005978]|uniref:helix-turn-helix domain-containing protein n=1 Tax=Nocardia sp. NPDC005978 TaxID=3156725 RepID=UPI0033BCD4C8
MQSKLRAARLALGYQSQKALAAALNRKAQDMGLRISVDPRSVRRWESPESPWPQPDHAAALEALLGRPLSELGFSPARGSAAADPAYSTSSGPRETWAARHAGTSASALPQSIATDFMSSTAAHRRMYWSVPAARLQRLVSEHAALGWDLLHQVPGAAKPLMARAVAESSLLAGRLEFFDLQQPDLSQPSFELAHRAAFEADDSLLGSAIQAHMAFAPAFSGDPDQAELARDKLRSARTFARRGDASFEMLAWLDAVEAEVETRAGDTQRALALLQHAEDTYAQYDPETDASPPWLDWFSPARLAGFRGNTQLIAGQSAAARETLERALAGLPGDALKQRAIYHADLAAVAVLDRDPTTACIDLEKALELLGQHWYATAMDRVKSVRQSLREWDVLPQVRALDDQLYSWHTTIKSLAR